jgi:hypothetical protein
MTPSPRLLELPDSDIARAAQGFVLDLGPAFVANHCMRSYLFARELAAVKGLRRDVDFDDELVFLGCILHDLGVTEHANGDQRFEVDGADAAAQFLRERGVPDDKIDTVWQAIALHTSAGLAHRFGTEHAVTQMGIAADVFGADRDLLPAGFADEVHESWPRHNLGYALSEAIARQIQANPLKGPPLSFPAHLHAMHHPESPSVTWFDVVRNSGWNDQPTANSSADAAPGAVGPNS